MNTSVSSRTVFLAMILIALSCRFIVAQTEALCKTPGKMLTLNRGWAKGGIGIIVPELYIVLKSANNELLFGDKKRWVGKRSIDRQIVVYVNGDIKECNQLDKEFDLRKAILVSFEGTTVRFFDFDKNEGGFYVRKED